MADGNRIMNNEERDEYLKSRRNDPVIVIEAISESIDEADIHALYNDPIAFGSRMQEKVTDYIESIVETELG